VQENFTEPSISNFPLNSRKYTESVKKAWQKFIANGQYRLAKRSELIFSDDILKKYPDKTDILYIPFRLRLGRAWLSNASYARPFSGDCCRYHARQ
jgi:hypothetical protein